MSELFYEAKNVWAEATPELKKEITDFSEGYKNFLNTGVTERKCTTEAEKQARAAGYVSIEEKRVLKAGDKVYLINRNKNIVLAHIGKKPVKEGANIVAAHIDAPRLDLKPVPVFEDTGLAYMKTHYYGGIKKYQWTAIPLALTGVVCTKNGMVEIDIDGEDICLCVTDLLPHLADKQVKKPMHEAIEGEKLNLLIGSIPASCEESKVKQTVLEILNEKYGICEEDFISAELEAYPAIKARDVGLDRSMVGGFGQDDRICGYTALRSIIDLTETPEKTAICVLCDKEEVGSMGVTGIRSMFFENIFAEIISRQEENYNDLMLRRSLSGSTCLSADVAAAFDPAYDYAYERNNSAYINKGLVLCKYTGARGKSGSSDANAELMGKIRTVFNEKGIFWQTGELGRIDEGGGGTVAQFVANLNIDTVDCGVAILSMHSPFEIAAKADVYMAYLGYLEFFKS